MAAACRWAVRAARAWASATPNPTDNESRTRMSAVAALTTSAAIGTPENTACATCADPANGTLVNNGDGTITYTPDPGFNGSDSFVYEICDTEPACDTAEVTIVVGELEIFLPLIIRN